MDKDAVVKLKAAGVSDSVVIGLIDSSPCTFDTSTEGVIALKNAGIDDTLVLAIIHRMTALAHPRAPYVAPAPAPPEPGNPDDPMAPHDAGVYLMSPAPDGSPKMLFIDRVGQSQMKVTNLAGAAFSFGAAKMKLKAVLPGAHAPVRATAPRPVFYMYFPDVASFGAFSGVDMITSPSQFSLSEVDVQKDSRETVIAKAGIGGASIGADEKKIVPFTSERIRPRVYKLTPSTDLKPGEYAFIAVMMGATAEVPPTTVVYDFGVDAKTP